MLERNWGRIIFISSEIGPRTPAEMIHYGMTKTAQSAISRGLAGLTKGTKVTVNSVLPGPTRSEGIIDFLKSLASEKTSIRIVGKCLISTLSPRPGPSLTAFSAN